MTCTAKASFSSHRSMSFAFLPACSSSLGTANTGPMPISLGSQPATAKPRKMPSGLRPRLGASLSLITAAAEAPSGHWRALAAAETPPSIAAVSCGSPPCVGSRRSASSPPAATTAPSPARTRCAASAMVCRPEEQKRFTVMPGTVTGQPARSAICRAILPPVAPSGVAQPMITSSTSSASTFARSSAACTACPPIFAPWVMLSEPRQLLHSGVLAVETITASVIEFPSFLRQFHEQRRRLPHGALVAFLKRLNRIQDLLQPDGIRVKHRPAAVGREAVAGEVHHVDVGGPQRDAFLEDLGAFVDEGVDEPLHDFLVGDAAGFQAVFASIGRNKFFNFRIRDGLPVAGLVAVPALAGLLPETTELADPVADARIDEVGALLVAPLADLPADVEARHVAHGEPAHREAPFLRASAH